MAFYLQRAFGDAADVLVFNDLRLVLDESGDAAQIDHLVVHRHGMAIVESKSVTTKVKVNAHGEWTRWWNGGWKGMASPVQQAQRQSEALRGLLQRHREELRDKKLFGLKQGGFKSCPIDVFIAISDGGMFDERSARPAGVMKAEAVADAVRELVERHRRAGTILGSIGSKPDDGMYLLTEAEVGRVRHFFLARNTARAPANAAGPVRAREEPPVGERARTPAGPAAEPPGSSDRAGAAACKHCGVREGEAQWGKYGYYLRCAACGKNTALEKRCGACGREARIRKEGARFWRECLVGEGGCGAAVVVWENGVS
jgi:nuclease-like protein